MNRTNCLTSTTISAGAPTRIIYGEAVRQTVIVAWESSGRICGKGLKAALPHLVGCRVAGSWFYVTRPKVAPRNRVRPTYLRMVFCAYMSVRTQ